MMAFVSLSLLPVITLHGPRVVPALKFCPSRLSSRQQIMRAASRRSMSKSGATQERKNTVFDDSQDEQVLLQPWWKDVAETEGGPASAADVVRFVLELSSQLDPAAVCSPAVAHELDARTRRSASVAIILRLTQHGRCATRLCVCA